MGPGAHRPRDEPYPDELDELYCEPDETLCSDERPCLCCWTEAAERADERACQAAGLAARLDAGELERLRALLLELPAGERQAVLRLDESALGCIAQLVHAAREADRELDGDGHAQRARQDPRDDRHRVGEWGFRVGPAIRDQAVCAWCAFEIHAPGG